MDPCDAVLDLLSIATDGSGVTSLGEAGAFGAARLLTVAGERLYFASGILGDGIYHVEL
jgi:hypothetical protein